MLTGMTEPLSHDCGAFRGWSMSAGNTRPAPDPASFTTDQLMREAGHAQQAIEKQASGGAEHHV
jgi:hypothetical protein